MVLSTHVVPSLKLDDKELGYVKQLKGLQREHSVLLLEYERLQEFKEGAVKQLNTAREINRETSQLIADLEERNKFLDQDKLGLELMQVKLEKEVETLKKKRSVPWQCTAIAVQQYTEQYTNFVVCAHFPSTYVPI